MKKIFLACLLATISINVFADSSISWVETTYLTKNIVGSWSALGATKTPCYTCKVRSTMCSFTAGANVASTALKKATKVHVLQINTTEQQSVKVFKRKRTNGDTYVVQLGNELFFLEEDTKSIIRCTSAFLANARELQYADRKRGFLIGEDNVLVIYH